MKTNNSENTQCTNKSCECKSTENQEDAKLNLDNSSKKLPNNQKNEETLDPTHFGDWQVNCRAIDF